MSEKLAALQEENRILKKRLKRLGREKANLQMAVTLINQIASTVGLENVVDHILQILVGAIGGSNIAIYYETENRWKYVDTMGNKRWMDEIDDRLVRNAVQNKIFLKEKEAEISKLTIPGFLKTYETWVYPLQVHGRFFGAVRLQGMAVEHAHYKENIDPFIQYSALVLYNEVSSIQKLTKAYQNIQRARKEAEQSREQFELAMRFANEGLYDWDLTNNRIYFSPVWKSMLGYTDDEIKNEFSEWERLTESEDVKLSWIMLDEVLNGKRDFFEKELQMRHKDGHWVNILSRANVIFNEKGKGVRVVGTHVDITRLKNMENQLRESEIKYRTIMEATKDPTYICSPDYRIEYMNPAMIEFVGNDATGKLCYREIHGNQDICQWCSFDKILNKESVSQEFVSPTNNRKYLSGNSPIVHMDGTISKLTVYHDITDLMEIESRLQQAQKMESIGNLAGGIAHDFNNILYPIIGMSELLLSDLPPETDEHDNAKEILTAGKRGAELIKQILTFSRQSEYKKISIKIQQVLNEVLKLSRSTIPADIEIHQSIDPECRKIIADPTQVHQVVLNLITNAYHALGNRGGKISVTLKEIELDGFEMPCDSLSAGTYALLSVSDNGIGIKKKLLNKIFEPYFTTKEKGKGTGLGLATVYGIVKGYRGDIRVYSEPGKGTTFNVYLPIQENSEETILDFQENSYPSGKEKVLIVDDEPSVEKLEARMLTKLGYRVTSFHSSIEALETFRSAPESYDIVVTDMTMPGITGDKLAEEMIRTRPDIRIVICTGFSERINKKSAKELGVKAFLMKPVGLKELSHTVRKVLDAV